MLCIIQSQNMFSVINGLYKKNVTNFVTDHETKGKSPVVNCTPTSPWFYTPGLVSEIQD